MRMMRVLQDCEQHDHGDMAWKVRRSNFLKMILLLQEPRKSQGEGDVRAVYKM